MTVNKKDNKIQKKKSPSQEEGGKLFSEVVEIKRVAKKTKGGNKISFTALIVAGDRNGRVGVALGHGSDVLSAINQGRKLAEKRLTPIKRKGQTIAHDILIKRGAAKLLLKPAPPGSGIIASQALKFIMEAGGIRDISVKVLGTNNKTNNVYTAWEALKED